MAAALAQVNTAAGSQQSDNQPRHRARQPRLTVSLPQTLFRLPNNPAAPNLVSDIIPASMEASLAVASTLVAWTLRGGPRWKISLRISQACVCRAWLWLLLRRILSLRVQRRLLRRWRLLRRPSPRAYPLRLEGSSGPSLRMNFAHRKEPPVTPAGLAHRSPTLRRI